MAEAPAKPIPKNLQFRAGVLLALTIFIGAAFVVYVLWARGVFEQTYKLTLVSDNAEGVSIGMDMTFSGFPIGRVSRLELAEDGRARIEVRIPPRDARWLKKSSIFTLERGIVGAARIRAFTGNLADEPLPDGAERTVLRGDTSEEIPRLVATLKSTLLNVEEMTGPNGALQASLGNLKTATDRLAGKGGALSAVLGSDEEAKRVLAAIERANALLAQLGTLGQRVDGLLAKADQRVFGDKGLMDGTQRAVGQANTILGEVQERLKQVDRVLAEAQQAAANAKDATAGVKGATKDLDALRAEVDASLRRITSLIEEINRKWPFARETEIKLR